MPIPTATSEQLVAAFAKFDEEMANTPSLKSWQENKAYKYAIRRNGQLYPVKKIIELATGTPVDSFSGGSAANAMIKKLGFTIEPIRLPAESEVIAALHGLLLSSLPKPIVPADAYRLLGDTFELSVSVRGEIESYESFVIQ